MKYEEIISQLTHREQETSTLRAMRWFFFVMVFLWIFAAMVLPVVAFCLTNNLISFYLFSTMAPPVVIQIWIVKYLFRDERDYKIAALKIVYAVEKERDNIKQIP